METLLSTYSFRSPLSVLTVPMRNGNGEYAEIKNKIYSVLTVPMRNGNLFCSSAYDVFNKVLTVPMRNGNNSCSLAFDRRISSYRTYEEWKPLFFFLRFSCVLVLTVPMRNGNRFRLRFFVFAFSGSYRTYEEWKLAFTTFYEHIRTGSYRTYEEWKRTTIKHVTN